MKIHYDAEVDALYIELRNLAPGTAECRELSDDIVANYTADGKLAGIEILDASVALGAELHNISIELSPFVGVRSAERIILPSH
jgi:uncharacterized protein YuzE